MSTPFPEPGEYNWAWKLKKAIEDRDTALLQAIASSGGGGGGNALVPVPGTPGRYMLIQSDPGD